ncbi:hypothetical protein [Microbacterium sp. 22296]|uniref:hypothetical protein n=1 Tax=Microbacterium sp. 22296 TaxID=3453903 RepID=UPI003F858D7B
MTLLAFASLLLTSCAPPGGGVDESMTLDQAKARAQSIEREIAETLTPDVLTDIDQRSKGTFLPCSGGEGEHWAGGLTASVMGDPSPERVTGQIASHFSDREDLMVRLRVDHDDSLVDIIGAHGSMWIVRYSREQAELDVDSFAPCVRLPEGVWRGDKY